MESKRQDEDVDGIRNIKSSGDLFKNELEEQVQFEQALKLAGTGRYTHGLLVITVYSLLAACGEIFSIGVIVVSSQCDLELDIAKRSFVSAIPMLGFIVSAHIWGYLADSKGRTFTLTICMAGTFLAGVITGFANSWTFLAVLKFCGAFFASGTMAVSFTLLGESTPETLRRYFLLVGSTGLMLAQTFVILFAYPTLQLSFNYYLSCLGFHYRPWRLLTQIYGLLNGVNLLLLCLFIYDSPKFQFSKGNHDKGLHILREIYKVNTGNDAQNYPVKRVVLEEDVKETESINIFRSIWEQTVPLFYKKHIRHTFLICYTCIVTYGITPPFSIWFPEIFNRLSENNNPNIGFCQLLSINSTESSSTEVVIQETVCEDKLADFVYIIMLSFSIYMAILSCLLMIATKFIGNKWTCILVQIFCSLCAILLNFVNINWGFFLFILMMTNACCMGITTSYTIELFPTYMRAMAVCLTIMVGRAVSFAFINSIGNQLLYNCDNFFYFLSAFILSGAIVALFLPADNNKSDSKKLTEDQENCDNNSTKH